MIFRGFLVSTISTAMVHRLHVKGVQPNSSVLFPNWVDLESITPQFGSSRLRNTYRVELGIKPDQLVLMYSGSMNKKQGLDLLAQVIHQLSDIPNIVWLLAGEGPTKAELVASTVGLPNVRHFPLQPSDRLNDWLNAADIHVLPQKAEAADLVLPSKLLGILASGRPVVATSPLGTELASIVQEAGCCVEPGDVSSFSAALRHLISSSKSRADSGLRARRIVQDSFGMSPVLERFELQLKNLHQVTHT